MKDVTIIIPHFESLHFLRTTIRQIRRMRIPEIKEYIIIPEQSCEETYNKVMEEFGDSKDVKIVKTLPLWSGYGIDYIFRRFYINTEYVCQLHADAFPISEDWLSKSIEILEKENVKFVGQLHFYSKETDLPVYPPGKFFSMSPTFNVAPTEIYRELSLNGGFTRYHERAKVPEMEFKSSLWADWAKEDYINRGSDDDTPAYHWGDIEREHDKYTYPITGVMEQRFGRIIGDAVFHFGSHRESIGVMEHMGENYRSWTKRIEENFSDELVDEIVAITKASASVDKALFWNGRTKTIHER